MVMQFKWQKYLFTLCVTGLFFIASSSRVVALTSEDSPVSISPAGVAEYPVIAQAGAQTTPSEDPAAEAETESAPAESETEAAPAEAEAPAAQEAAPQPLTVTGTVTDLENGDPVADVTVMVSGTSIQVTTDAQGQFSVTTLDPDAALEVSKEGFKKQTITIGGRSTINVTLESAIEELDKLVVVGYGTAKKTTLTGSVGTVDSKALNKTYDASVEKALQGKTPGVIITQNSGAPGKETRVRVRGVGSINNSDPLYVVDGVPMASISQLNSKEIESISVLKDAPACAIYGSRGANGVVLITTKKAKAGKASVSYDGFVGISNPWKKPDMCSASEWATLNNEAHTNADQPIDTASYPGFLNPSTLGAGTDWFDAVTHKNALNMSHVVSLLNGTDKLSYFLSGEFSSQDGIIKGSGYQKMGARMNIKSQLNDWFSFGNNLGVKRISTDHTDEGDEWESVIATALQMDPVTPLYDKDGNLGYSPTQVHNPVAKIKYTNNHDTDYVAQGNIFAEANILDLVKYRATYGIDYSNMTNYRFFPTFFVGETDQNGLTTVRRSIDKRFNWVFEQTLTLEKKLADAHNLKIMAGQTAEDNWSENLTTENTSTPGNDHPFQQLDAASSPTTIRPEGTVIENALLSYLQRIEWDYKGIPSLSISLREDGSSKFAEGNRWGIFPQVSGAWRLSGHKFLVDNPVISNLKIRGGWGQLGNQNVLDNYGFITVARSGQSYSFGDEIVSGTTFLTSGNPEISWEKQTSFGGGLDLGILNDKLELIVDYFHKKTTDMLYNPPIVGHAGLHVAPYMNVGEVKNNGFEATLNFKTRKNDFSIDLSGNLAMYRNEVIELGEGVEAIYDGMYREMDYVTQTAVGHSIGEFYGYVTDGLYQEDQIEIDGTDTTVVAKAGDIRYRDEDGDGEWDRDFIGNPNPDFTFGFNTEVGFKMFDFSFFLQGSVGNDIFNAARITTENNSAYFNLDRHMLNRWTPSHPTNDVTLSRLDVNTAANNVLISDRYVENGSYLRLKNIQLGFTLPEAASQKLKIQKLRIYVGAENLLTFTQYRGLDPEIGLGEDDNWEVDNANLDFGVDRGTYPQARTLFVGLNLTL